MISLEEEIELAEKIKQGDKEASKKLVEANLRFIISVAKQYQNKGLPLVDLIQVGCEGAIEASTRWDPSKGFKFISYAVWWIRQAILYALSSECRTVRTPISQVVNFNKITKSIHKLEQLYKRTPSTEEIAADLDMDIDKVNISLSALNNSLSLDVPFKDEEADSLIDVIPNKEAINTDNSIISESISKEIYKIISELQLREQDIIRMYYGLGMTAMSYEEISSRFGITSERCRQIHHEIISKIRDKYGDELKELL